jgi:hypothetical protein
VTFTSNVQFTAKYSILLMGARPGGLLLSKVSELGNVEPDREPERTCSGAWQEILGGRDTYASRVPKLQKSADL